MADGNNQLGVNDGDDDDIFVYTGGRAPRDVRRARIAENVDTIPQGAFYDCPQLIEVEGHDKVRKIGKDAFRICRRLRRLTNMNGVKEIERWAFGGCNALSDVDFDKLEIIGPIAFDSCRSLTSINMRSVRRIGESAFQYCHALTEAVFGEELEGIEGCAFRSCTALSRIVIPLKDNLIINNLAFLFCDVLVRVDVIRAGIHKTISSLHMESWRDEMREEIGQINQTLRKRGRRC